MNFKTLKNNILNAHAYLQKKASRAINISLSLRNWVIGYYIVEYEQKGDDRANYGDKILEKLALELKKSQMRRVEIRELRRFRLFYKTYPQIATLFSEENHVYQIWDSLTPELQHSINQKNTHSLQNKSSIRDSLTPELQSNPIWATLSPELIRELQVKSEQIKYFVPADKLLANLSFTHLVELIKIDDNLKRTFYEIECIKGVWSVRELRRQIETLYFERMGVSADKQQLSQLVQQNIIPQKSSQIVKDIYTFEFLDLPQIHIVQESQLEQALLNNFTNFILELGIGFCLEARQKRVLIGEEYYFIDLVFYHRILHCHVLIELKTKAFKQHNAAQLNTYLNYYKKKIVHQNENPPVGILLVADKNNELVEFATAGMDENLFVQKYLIQFPEKEQIEQFIKNELNKI